MSIGISLSIAVGAGLHAASGVVTLRRQFRATWGKTEVFVSQTCAWDLLRVKSWALSTGWSIKFAAAHSSNYGLRLEAANQHAYGQMRVHRSSFVLDWSELRQTNARHVLAYSDLAQSSKSMRIAYWLTRSVAVSHAMGYDLTNVNPVASRFTSSWALLNDASLQSLDNRPELVCNGRQVALVQASLSCDEDSPVWLASLEIAEVADFAAIAIGQNITLQLGTETFNLVVDGKTLSRESVSEQRYELSAVSPLALLDAPFAAKVSAYLPISPTGEATRSAHLAVESFIGPVSWELPDWIIPAGRGMFDSVTPLAAARSIVAAIGAVVESNPDGSVVCRSRHPISIPLYPGAEVDQSLADADVIQTRAQIAPSKGFNRVTVANEEGLSTAAADRIEYVADPQDPNRGVVRAHLAKPRPVVLTHTGDTQTVTASLGEVVREESEVLEFVEGKSSTRYPVSALGSAQWQHADLGQVRVTSAGGQELGAQVAGYSLLRLTYSVTTLNWQVALARDEEVQFVLVDA